MIALQRIRSLGISWTAGAMNWATDTFVASDGPITLSDCFGWWLEAQLGRAFGFFYHGSDEEIDAVRHGEIPRQYMNERQRAAGREFALGGFLFDDILCNDCDDALLVEDEVNLCAACRALHPEMLLEDRK